MGEDQLFFFFSAGTHTHTLFHVEKVYYSPVRSPKYDPSSIVILPLLILSYSGIMSMNAVESN